MNGDKILFIAGLLGVAINIFDIACGTFKGDFLDGISKRKGHTVDGVFVKD